MDSQDFDLQKIPKNLWNLLEERIYSTFPIRMDYAAIEINIKWSIVLYLWPEEEEEEEEEEEDDDDDDDDDDEKRKNKKKTKTCRSPSPESCLRPSLLIQAISPRQPRKTGESNLSQLSIVKRLPLPETNIARIAHEMPIFPGKYHQNGGCSMAMSLC